MVRKRGNSYQVVVYAGLDPLTGHKLYLRESTTVASEVDKILTRLLGQVDEQKHPKTRATFRVAMDKWLRTHDVEETTREGYHEYARNHLYPALGYVPVGRVTADVLEEFYAELRRCRVRCAGRLFVEHRTSAAR